MTGAREGSLDSLGDGRFAVTGALSFDSVQGLLAAGREVFRHGRDITIDLGGVTQADSAGLALLIEWLRAAHAVGQGIRFERVPGQLMALAKIGDVDGLLAG